MNGDWTLRVTGVTKSYGNDQPPPNDDLTLEVPPERCSGCSAPTAPANPRW